MIAILVGGSSSQHRLQNLVLTMTADKTFEEMWEAKGKPPVMFVDLRPLTPPMRLVTTYDIAEQVSRPSKLFPLSPTKSPTWTFMAPIIGMTSILGKEVCQNHPITSDRC